VLPPNWQKRVGLLVTELMRKTIIISTAGFLLILAVLITMMLTPRDTQSQSATAEPETQQPIAARPPRPPIWGT